MQADRQLSLWVQHQSRCRRQRLFCSKHMPVNTGVPQGYVQSPTTFLLHINDMLEDSSIHCYADNSIVDAVYSGRASLSRENAEQCRNKLVSSVQASSTMSPHGVKGT